MRVVTFSVSPCDLDGPAVSYLACASDVIMVADLVEASVFMPAVDLRDLGLACLSLVPIGASGGAVDD